MISPRVSRTGNPTVRQSRLRFARQQTVVDDRSGTFWIIQERSRCLQNGYKRGRSIVVMGVLDPTTDHTGGEVPKHPEVDQVLSSSEITSVWPESFLLSSMRIVVVVWSLLLLYHCN